MQNGIKQFVTRARSIAILATLGLMGAGAAAAQLQTTVVSDIDMSRPAGSCASFVNIVAVGADTVCTLGGSGGLFAGGKEVGRVGLENGVWVFRGNSCQPGVNYRVVCFRST